MRKKFIFALLFGTLAIDELNDKIKNFATDGTVEELQKKVKELTEQLDGINGNIDAMTVIPHTSIVQHKRHI